MNEERLRTPAPEIETPSLVEGGRFVDERGCVSFVNGFSFERIKRFYTIENATTDIVRAFHGHEKEAKFCIAVEGEFLAAAVYLDDRIKPSVANLVHRFILDADKPQILYIPSGYANGFRALTKRNKLLLFSTATLEESKQDDFRFPPDYWGKEVWDNLGSL